MKVNEKILTPAKLLYRRTYKRCIGFFKKTGYFIHDSLSEAFLIITQNTKHAVIYLHLF